MRFLFFIFFTFILNLSFSQNMSHSNKGEELVFNVNPNPADNHFTVTLDSNLDAVLRIFDVLGKEVFEEKINASKKISTDDFKTGVYIVSVSTNGSVYTKRLVVKH